MKAALTVIDNRLRKAESEITLIKSQMSSLRNEVSKLNVELQDVKDEVQRIKGSVELAYGETVILSYPITGIEISYSGSGTTNFDNDSKFHGNISWFDHWELDGLVMDKSNLLTVEVSSMQNIGTAIAYYCQVILLNFSVMFENEEYDVLLHVPLSSFN